MSANPFVERVANLLADSSYECRQAPDQWRALANRLEEAQLIIRPVETVHAAYPVQVRRKGLMVELDASALVKAIFLEFVDQFAADPEGVAEQILKIKTLTDTARAEHTLDGRGTAEHERDAKLTELIDELGGAEQHLTSENARDLGHLLIERAGPRLPHQQDRRAA